MSIIWLIGRVLFGVYFIMVGFNHFSNFQGLKQASQYKKIPMPGTSVIVSGLMLIIGGATILTGFYVGLGVLLLVLFLVISAFTVHNFWTLEDPMQKMGEQTQFMKNIALASVVLMLLQINDWSWML
ncbi:DoxX family protein [Bacillus sp. AFS055030]|uniref:DoxX family protein n=1 Tax=Bacillus sp. AFS055030 TaxID=2033507 RepID=UPI000BFC50A3|nr:DoxX family protein [Bacillus sp. AFS055030]PGL71021.1 DoxX family protein [Bacillus sp. AFS055030]